MAFEVNNFAKSLFVNSLAGCVILDEKGIIKLANSSFFKVTGYEENKVINQPIASLFHQKELANALLDRIKKQQSVEEVEIFIKTGSTFSPFLLNGFSFQENGETQIVCSLIEAHIQRLSDEFLVRAANREALLSATTDEGILIAKDGKVLTCNARYLEIFGFESVEEARNSNSEELFSTTEILRIKEYRNDLENTQPQEFQSIRKDGQPILLSIKKSPVKDQDGTTLVWRIKDISLGKRYELLLSQSEQRFKLLSEAAAEGIVLTYNGTIIDVNNRLLELYGVNDAFHFIGKELKDFVSAEELNAARDLFAQRNSDLPVQLQLSVFDGKKIFAEVRRKRLPYNDKTFTVWLIQNITTRKLDEENLRNSFINSQQLLDSLLDGLVIIDNLSVVYANAPALNLFGKNELNELLNARFDAHLDSASRKALIEEIDLAKRNIPAPFREIKMRVGGKSLDIEIKAIPVKYFDRDMIQIVIRDVSMHKLLVKEQMRLEIAEITNKQLQKEIEERKMAEARLMQAQGFTRSIIDSSLDMIIASDTNGVVREFNPAAQKSFGYTLEEMKAIGVEVLYHDAKQSLSLREALLSNSENFKGEITNRRKNGETFVSYLSASVIRDDQHNIVGYMGVSRDITELKEAEETLKTSLREKEVLLKEVHHRVKNNLQVISSIINLQSHYVKDSKTLEMLNESQNRIKSMAFIHEKLYQTKDFANINITDYIKKLSQSLVHSYRVKKENITLQFDLEDIVVDLDQSIPCGLIINELVSNALKYAFPDNRDGIIFISMFESENMLTLRVKDDGIGLPDGLDYKNTESLGLQLVVALTDQLDGEIVLDRKNGTSFTITFAKLKRSYL